MDKKPQPPARLVDAAADVLAATTSLLDGASKTAEAVKRDAARKAAAEEEEKRQRQVERNRRKKAKKVAAKKLHKQQQLEQEQEKTVAKPVAKQQQPIRSVAAAVPAVASPPPPRIVTALDGALSSALATQLKMDDSKLKSLLDNSQLYCALVDGSKVLAFGRVLTDFQTTALLLDVQSFGGAHVVAVVDALLANPKLARVENVFCSAAVDARFAQGALYRKVK